MHHEKYYIPGGDLFIVVEKILFRVDSYFFQRESNEFAELITPASPGAQPQGSDVSTAIILDALSVEDFAKFLWVFYNPLYSLYNAAVEDWEVILTLSDRWSFPEVKNLAIRELEKIAIPDVKRIKLYHEHNVDRNYLIPCYIALCERGEPLTAEEGIHLGMITVTQIVTAREHIRRVSHLASGTGDPSTPIIHKSDLHEVIRQIFNIAPPEIVSFSTDEISNTTDALLALTIQPTFLQVKQPAREEEQTAPPQQPKPQRKKGKQKVKQVETGTGTAPESTAAIPQKLAATPTPTPTQMKNRPWPVAEETKDKTKSTSEAEDDGTAPQPTTVVPHKPVTTPTPTRMKTRLWQMADETKDETKPLPKKISETEGDVA